MQRTTLKISGIHCASCSIIIEKGLTKKDGISEVSVNLSSNTANINFDETKTDINIISKQISELGYKVVQQLDTNGAKKYLKRFFFALFLSLPIVATMFIDFKKYFSDNILIIDSILLLLGTLVVFISGWSFHIGFIKKLRQGQSNMDTLVSVGTLVAWGFSLYAFFQTYFMNNEIEFYSFLESSIFIITFISLGKYLELKSKGSASNAIQKLMQLQVKEAIILQDGKEVKVPIDDIKIGDIVVVKAGDKIAVDGYIVKGQSSIDEVMLTGESMHVSKQEGDNVFTGTIVKDGILHIKVTKEQNETMLAKILQTVNDAQSNKPPIQHLVDKISSVFVPFIILFSILAFVGRYWYTGDFGKSLLIMIATIVIACPCAMGLATPMAIMVATGTGANRGILIKGGEVLEKSKNIDVVMFDKTGTLTEGKPTVTDLFVIPAKLDIQSINTEELLSIAYSLASNSNHPLSQAIISYSQSRNIQKKSTDQFKEIPGKGVQAFIESQVFYFGNQKLLDQQNISISSQILSQIEKLQEEGKTVNFITKGNILIGLLALLDIPKVNTIKGIKTLKKMGIKTVMISGDTNKTVEAIAKQIGIDERYGGIFPSQKSELVQKIQKRGFFVAFVGDGINDSPALAQSDLGIAIGQGSDIAIETAEMVLVNGDPYKVVEAIKLARKTYKIIQQNLFRAFVYNAILVPVAALGYLDPIFASFAMSMSSVTVALNSLRLKK